MKIAIVGTTGLVGSEMIKVLEEMKLPISSFFPVASEKSVGKIVSYNGKKYPVMGMKDVVAQKPDIAVFSVGGAVSKQWAPEFAKAGTTVIDNSSAWRMQEDVPLIVPEINAHTLTKQHKIIANPNCSTIQMVVALAPLHKKYSIRRIVVSTYQSVTGTGIKAVQQLENERKGVEDEKAYPYPIDLNIFPHGGIFLPSGYTTEEQKLADETQKILDDPSIRVTATVVRVPVFGGHSEAVNVEFANDFDINEVRELLRNTPGIVVQDDIEKNIYPMPLYARGKNEVFVGRIRRDGSNPNSLNLWIVTDNLRKGAATNALQIAAYLIEKGFV